VVAELPNSAGAAQPGGRSACTSGHLVLTLYVVMAGLDPAIHVFDLFGLKDVDARHKAGHDG
jgi:hypothetical protein